MGSRRLIAKAALGTLMPCYRNTCTSLIHRPQFACCNYYMKNIKFYSTIHKQAEFVAPETPAIPYSLHCVKTGQVCLQLKTVNNTLLNYNQVRFKGHSHWQNIRHTKEAEDFKYSVMVSQMSRHLKVAMKAGGFDPMLNKQLANVITKMKNLNIPKADIQRMIENATNKANLTQTYYYEVKGPGGSVFVVETSTSESQIKMKEHITSMLKKTAGKLSDGTSAIKNMFEQKGVVTVRVTKELQINSMDEYLEIAIETGAEDVILLEDKDEESGYVLKFHCNPLTVSKVAKDIEETYDLQVSSSEVEFIPLMWVTIDQPEVLESCRKIVTKLQTIEDVANIFDNISIKEE